MRFPPSAFAGLAFTLAACGPLEAPPPPDAEPPVVPGEPAGNGEAGLLSFDHARIGVQMSSRIQVTRSVAVGCGPGCTRVDLVPIRAATARLEPPLAEIAPTRLTAAGAAEITFRGQTAGAARLIIDAVAGDVTLRDAIEVRVLGPELFALGCDLDGFSLSQGVLTGTTTRCELTAFAHDQKLGALVPRAGGGLEVSTEALDPDGLDGFTLTAMAAGRGTLLASAGGQVFLGTVDVVSEDEVTRVGLLDTGQVRTLPDAVKLTAGATVTVRPQVGTADGRSALGFEHRLMNSTPAVLRLEALPSHRVRVVALRAGLGSLLLDVAGRRWEIPVLVD